MAGKTHWKKLRNPDYLGAWDFDEGEERTLTISNAKQESVAGPDGKREDCMVLYFRDVGVKPMIVNATNAKMIQKHAGTPYIEDWGGVKISIHVEKVKAFGDIHDALRVMKTPSKKQPAAPAASAPAPVPVCSDCGGDIKAFGEHPAEYIASRNEKRYGRKLCIECAKSVADNPAPVAPIAEEVDFLD